MKLCHWCKGGDLIHSGMVPNPLPSLTGLAHHSFVCELCWLLVCRRRSYLSFKLVPGVLVLDLRTILACLTVPLLGHSSVLEVDYSSAIGN